MPARIALFLDANRLTAYAWNSGRLSAEGQFPADSHGLDAFAQYLVRRRRSLFYLLAEVFDEGFRLEDIPYVRGRDRHALLTRKLDQSFHGTPLNLALSLGREHTGRRDEKMLFAGLTRPQHLEPWLATLRAQEGRLAGIYSIPLIAGPLIDDLAAQSGATPRPLLLVTLTSGGLRQTFFIDGKLRFSRLMALPSTKPEQCASTCAAEADSTYHYLVGQRQISRGTSLPTLILAHPGEISSYRNHCRDTGEIRFGFIDLLHASEKSGLKTLPDDTRSEALFMHLMLKRRPHIQFAQGKERRFFHLGRARSVLNSSGILIILGCLLFSGKQLFDGYRLERETQQLRLQAEADTQRYASILNALPPLPTSVDKLSSLTSRYADLERQSASLEATMSRISHALQGSPDVQVNRIEWWRDASHDEGMRTPVSIGHSVSSDVYAQLPTSLARDKRALLDAIQAFSADLGKGSAAEVRILKLPFDTAPGTSLKGSDEPASGEDVTSFSLRIVEKP